MTKKKIIIIGFIIVIVGAAIFAWFTSGANPASVGGNAQNGNQSQSFVVTGKPANIPAGETITIGTPKGIVTTKNFYKTVTASEEEYLIFQTATAYAFLYDPMDSSFVISITAGPIAQVQSQAEAAFLAALGINKTDACKLVVVIGISVNADPALAGKSLPLSFCGVSGVIQ